MDNASTDETSRVASASWPADAPARFQIVDEPRLGLNYARERGLLEAQYEFISFIDDDNWVSPDWVQLVFEVMKEHPEVGACGGFNEAVCEVPPPWWFEQYKGSYAVGSQGLAEGDMMSTGRTLWGAGLVIRRPAWEVLVKKGFHLLLTDRRGEGLASGGDSELCLALHLAGWKLWYEPRLRLRHFIPAERLRWDYLRRGWQGLGASSLGHDPYYFFREWHPRSLKRIKFTWSWRAVATLKFLLSRPRKLLLSFLSPLEGDSDVFLIEYHLGRLIGLLRLRNAYDRNIRGVYFACWRRTSEGARE